MDMTVVLDKEVLLSQSSLWQRQRDFYARSGVSAWHNQVPFYATSNAFIAKAYAEMIRSFMQDWHQQHGSKHFRILELGAGSGQFTYLCLHELKKYSMACEFDWKYILSDFDESLIEFWQEHKGFIEYTESGRLIFVKNEVGRGMDTLQPLINESDAPLIVIANYLFDSLPADIYKIGNEEVRPVSITITTDSDNLDQYQAVKDFEKISLACVPQLQPEMVTDDILNQYRLELLDTHILYPQASLNLIKELTDVSKQGVFLLVSDKAYVHIDELDYLEYPEITGHNGCFSVMVNYDAIARFAKLNQGAACLPSTRAGIKTAAFSFGFDFNLLHYAPAKLKQCIDDFSPADYLHLYRNMQKKLDSYSLEDALSFLALSNWDATVFQRLYERIFEQLDGADMLSIHYLTQHLASIADHYYWLGVGQDCFFQIAIICHTLKLYDQALIYYERSLHYFDAVFGLYFNMGVCHYHLNQIDLARDYFEKAQKLDPHDKKTKEWLAKL